jgi:hypothetical protein
MAQLPFHTQIVNNLIRYKIGQAVNSDKTGAFQDAPIPWQMPDPLANSQYAQDIRAEGKVRFPGSTSLNYGNTPPAVSSFIDATNVELPDPPVADQYGNVDNAWQAVKQQGGILPSNQYTQSFSKEAGQLFNKIVGVVSSPNLARGIGNIGSFLQTGTFPGTANPSGPVANSPSEDTTQPKGPADKATDQQDHAAQVEAAKTAIANGGQPTDKGGIALATEIGIKHAESLGADVSSPDVYAQIQAHAKQMMDEVPPEKKIDLLSAGLGILAGMGDQSAPFASVVGKGLQQGVEAATQDRQRNIQNMLMSTRTATEMAGAQNNADQVAAARSAAGAKSMMDWSKLSEQQRHNLASEAAYRARTARDPASLKQADDQLQGWLHSYAALANFDKAGEDLPEGKTMADRVTPLAFPTFKALIMSGKYTPEEAAAAAFKSQSGTGFKVGKNWNIGTNTVSTETDSMPGMINDTWARLTNPGGR